MDYTFLREEGIPHLERMAGKLWTDFNTHDPGITILGQVCYAITDLDLIDERPYVDYVAEVKLFSSADGRTFRLALPSASEGYWVQTDRPDGVLVAARQHVIDLIAEASYAEEAFTGINYMRVELDFLVG